MTATPVGMRCPDCAGDRQRVQTLSSLQFVPYVTYGMMAICALLYVISGNLISMRANTASTLFDQLALNGPAIDPGQDYWRLLTGGFLHAGLLHLLFNMYALFWLGQMLEPALGHVRFLAIYLASLIVGSFGALLLDPGVNTVGASGAIFGLMGAAFVAQSASGINPMQSGLGPIILINLGLGFVVANISIGGHVGGLIGGALCALVITRVQSQPLQIAYCAMIGVIAAVAGVMVAGRAF